MKLLKKSVSILLVMTMIVSLFTIIPFEASAAGAVEYIYRYWDEANQRVADETRTCASYTTITSQDDLTIGDGKWYVVNGDATIENRVTVSGTAHIILLSGTLRCMYGIRLSKGNSLFVYPGKNSEGTLNPRTAHDEEASLGGNEGEDCGEFVFYGGTLEAHNYEWSSGGAAIGGGGEGGSCGKLSFYGGTVDASNNGRAPGQKSYGAVIGDGDEASSDNSDCYINIYGGNITVDNHSDSNGSGIGGGEDSTGCPINILGGKITARAYNGAAIGSGQDGGSSTITIKNAKIKAESEYGAGIGSGEDSDSESIIIENSYVEAASKTTNPEDSWVGAEGAGIGGGNCGKSKYIKINKSVIIASSGRYGAGIGGGDESDGGTIEITDSCVFAHSAQGGAGIGGGDEKGCDSITLKDSFVVAITDSDMNEAGEKFLKDFGDDYNTIMYSISNPAVSEQAGFYAAGSLTAMAIAYLIQGTHTGAGIGSGDSGKAEKILIDNCTVVTQAGECAAGIGGGDEGGFGTIDIKNSHIFSQGGKYGAGIGSGDEAEDCGTINITDSDITAKGGSEGAGIGTGNETDETAKINISGSTVDAHGGKYGAGVGGGDAVGGGSIRISSYSTVNAYGGEDAAGIGGGEGGDGGDIEISRSTVYAEGVDNGSGIGNGEDGDKTSVNILSGSQVTAWGGNGGGKAVGFADNGAFYSAHVSTYIDDTLKVEAGKNTDSADIYYKKDRYNAVWDNRYAKIFGCPHTDTVWKYDNSSFHVKYCNECGTRLGSRIDRHEWNSDHICTVCGGSATMVTITLKEKDSSGKEIVSQTTVPQYTEFVFPECKNAPDGYEFVCWKQVYSDGYTSIYSYAPGDTESSLEATYEAIYLPLAETAYIAADGTEQTVRAKVLDDSYEGLHLNNGWYVLAGNHTYYEPITIDGSVKLIVPDGITFSTVGDNTRILYGNRKTSAIAVFGQREQTGTLDFGSRDFSCPAIKVYGGHINCQATTSFGGVYGTEIARGTIGWRGGLSVPKAGVTISGGNLNFSGQTILTGELQLGWTKLTDSVRFASIRIIDNPKNHGSIVIADNQAFKDEAGNIYTGALTDDQISAIQGKTLTPCLLHNYGEPEWNWSNEYKDASATFKCVDAGCGYEQTVSAKVTYRDEGDYRIASASCQFNGETYTIERTARIIFDVHVENNAAGTITVSDAKAKSGNKVKVSLTPNNGYFAKSFTVTADDDARVIESDNKSFIMPEGNVTVKAEFGEIIPMVEPYIDEDGAYHLGTVAYAEIDGEPYAVNEDGTIGDLLDSVELSYFDFELLDDDTYRINRYTGPTDTLSELVIPKTFNGKQITVLGNSSTPLIDYAGKAKTQFELTLTENIREIKGYTFYTMWVKKVKGDSSGLNKLGDYAFSWANSPDGYKLDIKLDHEGTITAGSEIFNHMNVTLRLKHATKFNTTSFSAQKVTYDFTDAHTYGDPTWQWADDHSSAKAKFTCTDSRCKHTETVDASVTADDQTSKTVYTAAAQFENQTYTDEQTVDKNRYNVIFDDIDNGAVSADKENPYEDEEVTLTISPDTGYKLSTLTVKDSSNNEIPVIDGKFTMPSSDVTVSATFEQKDYDITYEEADEGWVKGVYSAKQNEEITITAIPAGGFALDTLTVKDSQNNPITVTNNKFTMPADDVTVSATFRKIDLNITYEACEGGTVSGPSKAQFNDEVQITITPDEGYIFNNLIVEDEWGETPTLTENGFIMPSEEVTVTAEFLEIVPAKEPWIDEQGEYHLGNVEYIDYYGDPYSIDENGELGEELESTDLSYFDFKLINNDTEYQINYYTGPTDDLTELVIPKTYKGKPITVLGTDNRSAFIANANPKPQFTLTLNENIREIKGYAFYTMWVKQVKGDSSGLNRIGDYAFSWANSPNNYTLDIKLDHEGTVTVGKGIFNNMTVTARIRHATKLSSGSFMQKSISYILTDDAHTYGQPKWTWSDDHGTAAAKFTCTDSRCRHEETVEATVTSATKDGVITYTATAELDGETYTDIKTAFSDGVGARVIGHTISLDGDIAVNFYMELDPEIAQSKTAYMQFTIPDTSKEYQEQTVKVCEAEKKDGYYIFKCRVAAKDMETLITAQIIYGDRQGTPYTYSVKQYADYLVEHQDDSTIFKNAVPLVQAMIAYGENAKWYFGKTDEDPDKINIEIPEYKSTVYDLPEGVTFGGATLSLKSETTLSLYFNSETEPTLTCADPGVTYETGKTGTNEYVIRIRGIAANDLNKPFTVNVNGTKAVEYSALTYCFKAQNNSNPKLVNTVKALYQYWQQADLYFKNQEGN